MEARHYQDSPGYNVGIPPQNIGSMQVLVDATAHVVSKSRRGALKAKHRPGHGSENCGGSLPTRQKLSKDNKATRSAENNIALDVLTTPHVPQPRSRPPAMSTKLVPAVPVHRSSRICCNVSGYTPVAPRGRRVRAPLVGLIQ